MPKTILGLEVTRQRVFTALAVVLALVALSLLYRQIDVEMVHAYAQRWNGFVVFLALTLLPMVGFPVSVLHVMAGVRFGIGLGLALVALSMVLQLLASYGLVKLAPGFFARRMAPIRDRLPDAAHRPLTQFTMLLPGVPYFAQNYVLPLMGVPLGTYLLWSVPIHFVRSIVGVVFGEWSNELTPARIALFCAYGVAITLACAWSLRHLRAQLRDRPRGEGGRTQPA